MKYKLSIVFLLFASTLWSQDKKEGLPISVKVITTKSYIDGAVELAGFSNSLSDEPGQVIIEIIKPKGGTDNLTTRADKKTGEYALKYTPTEMGKYKVIAYASDKKQTATAEFTVTAELDAADDEVEKLDKAVDKAMIKIEEAIQAAIATDISAPDKEQTKKELQKVKAKISEFKEAGKQIKNALVDAFLLAKKYPELNKTLAAPLGKLSSIAQEKSKELEQVEKTLGANKEKEPNICNTAYVIKESCALLSTVMNVVSKSIITIVDNIMIDKGWPKALESLAPKKIEDNDKFLLTQSGKAFLSAKGSLQNLGNVSFGIGIAGDLTQHIMEQLFKKYCAEYKGPLTGDYTLEFKNNGKMYMRYKITYSAKISIYCKKTALNGSSPKLSGYIDGNVTKMEFTDDVWAVEDKSSWDVIKYLRMPAIVPSFNLGEKDPGFGVVARSIVPGSFYFPLEAQMVDGKMVIKLMPAHRELDQTLVNRSLVIVQQKNNPLSLQAEVFSYPITTARFILTRTMRMADASPTVTLDMIKKGEFTTLEKTFTRTETPAD
ncbi:MAG: hypothetical protein KA290_14270, partial [Chitinophagaceae bacterium]|nr:hypothetical protein [Chitinophagaceae bacterium]